MTEKLDNLFIQAKKYGKHTRTNKLDGLAQWNRLKGILIESKVVGKWNPQVKTFFVDMRSELKIQECENEIQIDDEKEKHDVWEKHHFYLQHARIPTLNFNDGKLVRLIQIAYNAGQLEALWDDLFYTPEMKRYYDENHLGDMETYMDITNLKLLNNSITDEIIAKLEQVFKDQQPKGGYYNYEHKYLKYKNKYLNLKNK
ncbi:hypothetical protein QKU48_gp1332 [Fadolivirus algeromassiliense]|jgi:hypothetical protein|uniref:Uncharacterized protein n=1 Tax=Fadolivirus FV1/VV64 TaxID=3070911 RepID=A0A7D3UU17_9VIRU|nr:hypothetical protein QKU48_gp1332 [Fadolivirus algeromassiliense]QKF94790.1 hypothetical protein Fadolivirus_1_1332 [Fadolivirus FV1/VV64]